MDGNVVNHPAHYQLENGMEAIDIIKGTLGDRGYKAFCRGNTLKYLLRAGKKGLISKGHGCFSMGAFIEEA